MIQRNENVIARLALEDGTVFTGRAFGACNSPKTYSGEVVFNTAMCGYQEALTDPSYAGQILIMTTPMIGNYGVNSEDVESSRPHVRGFVIRELSRRHSSFRAEDDLSHWLSEHGILAIEGIDTRALVRRIRMQGAMRGTLSCDSALTDDQLVEQARSSPEMAGQNLAATVSAEQGYEYVESPGRQSRSQTSDNEHGEVASLDGGSNRPLHVLALDCGGKRNIYRNLTARGCRVQIVPWDISAEEIRSLNPDGLFISNGPGDPDAVSQTVATLREVAGEIPTFGICLGHQLLALALGAKTYKLKFGHRGANQPVRNLLTGRVEITSQNHGFCVDADSLRNCGAIVTHIHLNDGTVAGFRHRDKPIFSVQYHPEASPGPHDSAYLFDSFVELMRSGPPPGEPPEGSRAVELPGTGQ